MYNAFWPIPVCFPSPRPSPLGRGSDVDQFGQSRTARSHTEGERRFSLSPREKAGVRENTAPSRPHAADPGAVLSSPNKFLHAVIPGVSNVEISARIEGDAPRIAQLPGRCARSAQDFHRLIVRIKDLNAAVAKFTHILVSGSINPDVIGITHLSGIFTRLAVRSQPFSIRAENLDAVV